MALLDELAFGWDHENEPQLVDSLDISLLTGAADVPDDFDIVDFTQKLQFMWPFCHAHMRTGMASCLGFLQTQVVREFSRKYAAITDMRQDGNDSSPCGASIGGSILASNLFGEALESVCPYFPNCPSAQLGRYYSNQISQAVITDAAHRHMGKVKSAIRSYSDLLTGLTSGRCVAGVGIPWLEDFTSLQSIGQYDNIPRGGSLGGHALLVCGWKTIGGEKWPLIHNSHPRWGIKQRCAWSPRVWDYILKRSAFGAFIVSNIQMDDVTKPQDWTWLHTADFAPNLSIKWA